MTFLSNRPTGFMDLPLEIREMIYKLLVRPCYPLKCDIYPHETDGHTWYEISKPTRRLNEQFDCDATEDLLCVNHQIHDEVNEVLRSAVLCIDVDDVYPTPRRHPRFFPRRVKHIHSVFGHLRHLRVGFNHLPWGSSPVDNGWEEACLKQRERVNTIVRSLLPPRSCQDRISLRSLRADIDITDWDMEKNYVSGIFEILNGFITVVPPEVDVSLTWSIWPDCEDFEDDVRAGFGNRIMKDFAKKRAAHVSRVTKRDIADSQSLRIECGIDDNEGEHEYEADDEVDDKNDNYDDDEDSWDTEDGEEGDDIEGGERGEDDDEERDEEQD